ncbi:hypothetical protein BDD12DRAFT_984535 [Trichophaea hybrida]|nr:hypothetical protein BDD12DRAFT_984535 [Trichophaea hybrida]
MTSENIIQELLNSSLTAFRYVLAERKSKPDSPGWAQEKDRLILWGGGFDVFEGGLDRTLCSQDGIHIKESIITLLCSLTGLLIKPGSQVIDARKTRRLISDLKKLRGVIAIANSEAAGFLGVDAHDQRDEWQGNDETRWSGSLKDVIMLNGALFGLIPFVEELEEKDCASSFPAESNELQGTITYDTMELEPELPPPCPQIDANTRVLPEKEINPLLVEGEGNISGWEDHDQCNKTTSQVAPTGGLDSVVQRLAPPSCCCERTLGCGPATARQGCRHRS